MYASTPFKLRKALHKEAAEWIAARHRKSFSDRAEVMPILISHLTQAHEEGRAQAMLAVLKVPGYKHTLFRIVVRKSDLLAARLIISRTILSCKPFEAI